MRKKQTTWLPVIVLLVLATTSWANQFFIDMAPGRGPRIQVEWIDTTNGKVKSTLNLLVDEGNLDGDIILTNQGASKLGITPVAGGAKLKGAGGEVTAKQANLNVANRQFKVKGVTTPTGQTQKTITFTGTKNVLNIPGIDGVVGQDFLSNYNTTYNRFGKKISLIDKPQWAAKRAAELAKYYKKVIKPLLDSAGSAIHRTLGPYFRSTLELETGENAGNLINTTFDFGFVYDYPILNEMTANLLGIDLGTLIQEPVQTLFGTVQMWKTQVFIALPGDLPGAKEDVFIIPDAFNEDGVNLLPAEILWDRGGDVFTIEDYDPLNAHYVHLIPEPATIVLFYLGGWVVLARRKRSA